MIALDLDGTLLNRDHSISSQTKIQMKRLHEQGVIVGIATGRGYDLTCNFLLSNGVFPDCGYPQFLICEEREIHMLSGSQYEPFSQWNNDLLENEIKLLPLSREKVAELEEQTKLEYFFNNTVMQKRRGFVELRFTSKEDVFKAFACLEETLAPTKLKPIRNGTLIAIRYEKVGKGIALQQVAKIFSVDHNEILAIGDSHNDVSMLGSEYIPATTDNADEEIKRLVNDNGGAISTLQCSDGVADILKKI